MHFVFWRKTKTRRNERRRERTFSQVEIFLRPRLQTQLNGSERRCFLLRTQQSTGDDLLLHFDEFLVNVLVRLFVHPESVRQIVVLQAENLLDLAGPIAERTSQRFQKGKKTFQFFLHELI